MTIEMAKDNDASQSDMRPRARRLLEAVLPHAIALETIELEEDILALIEIIDTDNRNETGWKAFLHKVQKEAKSRISRIKKDKTENI